MGARHALPAAAGRSAPLRFVAVVDGPTDGPVVFLRHGWPQTQASWDDVVPMAIGDDRLEALVADVLGMAESSTQPPG